MLHPGSDAGRAARVLHQQPPSRQAGLQHVPQPFRSSPLGGNQVRAGGDQQRRLRQLAFEQVVQRRVGPRQRPARQVTGQQARVGQHGERHRLQRHFAPAQQRVYHRAGDVHAGAHRLGEHVLGAVRRQGRDALHQLRVAAAEAAAGDFRDRGRGAGQRAGVDQHLALVVGYHRRPHAAVAQQFTGAADCRALAAAQKPADQVQLHAPIVPGERAGGQSRRLVGPARRRAICYGAA